MLNQNILWLHWEICEYWRHHPFEKPTFASVKVGQVTTRWRKLVFVTFPHFTILRITTRRSFPPKEMFSLGINPLEHRNSNMYNFPRTLGPKQSIFHFFSLCSPWKAYLRGLLWELYSARCTLLLHVNPKVTPCTSHSKTDSRGLVLDF